MKPPQILPNPYKDGNTPDEVKKALQFLVNHTKDIGAMHIHFINGNYMILITCHPDVIDVNMQLSQDIAEGKCLQCGETHDEDGKPHQEKLES